MKHRAASVARVTAPVKALLNRFALLFLILSAFAIMLLGKAETVAVERVRSGVVDIVAPVMDGLSRPIATVSSGIDRVENFFSVYDENERLREQNARLLEWQSAALALAAENSTFPKCGKSTPPGLPFCLRLSRINFLRRNTLANGCRSSGFPAVKCTRCCVHWR